MDPRPIDPTAVWVRHVRHDPELATATSADRIGALLIPAATSRAIAGGVFVAQEDALTGWEAAGVTLALSDHGTFNLRLPNAAGDDGLLHRRRFAVMTELDYEPGDEWLEFWVDGDEHPIAVGTPTDGTKTPADVVLNGVCVLGTLDGFRTSEVDAWDPSAPVDVARHYLRAPVLALGDDAAVTTTQGAGFAAARPAIALTGVAADCWTAEARFRWTSTAAPAADSAVAINLADVSLQFNVSTKQATLYGPAEGPLVSPALARIAVPGPITLRIVARYERLFAFVEGELVGEYRRAAPFAALPTLSPFVSNGTVTLDAVEVESLAPYAARTADATVDRRLPGLPPATGLRARYYNAATITATTLAGRTARLWPIAAAAGAGAVDPTTERLEPTLDLTTVAPGMAGAYAARWEGAIYLDLKASDRELRIIAPASGGIARVYVGRTRRGLDEAASSWAVGGTITAAGLRAQLGQSSAGWYPIVVEVAKFDTNAGGWRLEDRVAAGAWATVPTSRLSPLGVYADLIRNEPHGEVLTDVLRGSGYQWRTVPRSLESGGFPGQVAIAPRIGTDLDVTITDEDVGTDVAVEVRAEDVVAGLAADAAGIADPAGAEQLAARMVDYARARGKPTLRIGYESLSEITEAPLLRTRMRSLLALRSSPNETVGVRPLGQRDLADTFPLTGALRLNRWEPGDGVRRSLESVDVIDPTPTQLTRVAWTLRPSGLGHPVVGFRQRPRGVRVAVKRMLRIALAPNRTDQSSGAAGRTY